MLFVIDTCIEYPIKVFNVNLGYGNWASSFINETSVTCKCYVVMAIKCCYGNKIR